MRIEMNLGALRRMRFHDFAARFLFGGTITVTTGIIGKEFGPVVAGLFLAFPAILPATASLIEKHERERMHRSGFHGTVRGRTIASVDVAGAAMGSLGLIAFGFVAWQMLPRFSGAIALSTATVCWFTVAFTVWWIRRRM